MNFIFILSFGEHFRHLTNATDGVRVSSSYLSPIDKFFAVLLKLKVGLYIKDIAEIFELSPASLSRIFTTCISLPHAVLKLS